MRDSELIEIAIQSRKHAYAPYSGFMVGAALLASNGTVYTGCNIENASFSPTVCAERTAFFKAISEGVNSFEKIAVVGGADDLSENCSPCGVCRQVMLEFCDPDKFKIILGSSPDNCRVYTLAELYPHAFKL